MDGRRMARRKLGFDHSRDLSLVGRQELPAPRLRDSRPGQARHERDAADRLGPLTKQIKSWVFDSDGGYGDALWTRNGNQWIIKSTGVLPDGRIATATNVLTRTGPNTARWASTQRTVGGQLIPDHRESVMVRRPPHAANAARPK